MVHQDTQQFPKVRGKEGSLGTTIQDLIDKLKFDRFLGLDGFHLKGLNELKCAAADCLCHISFHR